MSIQKLQQHDGLKKFILTRVTFGTTNLISLQHAIFYMHTLYALK